MKQLFSACFIIFLFLITLLFPTETLFGASKGLLLWFEIILPTLLPFLILSNLLIHTNAIRYISFFVGPVFEKIFGVSKNGSFAILTGFLCGYPIGAKVTSDLVRRKHISLEEGKYLLSFCNNTSPAFISNYIVIHTFQDKSLLLCTMIILYLSPFICSFIFKYVHHSSVFFTRSSDTSSDTSSFHFAFSMLDDCIMDAFETITKVGGYIILFSIFISLGTKTPFSPFLPILEITNGIQHLMNHSNSFSSSYILILSLTSFGGLCSIVQTNSMLQNSGLSIGPYIIEKLITAMVTSLFAFCFTQFYM